MAIAAEPSPFIAPRFIGITNLVQLLSAIIFAVVTLILPVDADPALLLVCGRCIFGMISGEATHDPESTR